LVKGNKIFKLIFKKRNSHIYILEACERSAKNQNKKKSTARRQWLPPIILATQQAEIRRIMVQSQPGQIAHETLPRKNPSQKRSGGVAQCVGHEFKPQYQKERKKERKKKSRNKLYEG
jgi:hypothetical protein